MKIYYDPKNGTIFYAVKNRDIYWFIHSTNIPLDTIEVLEIEENKLLCQGLAKYTGKVDNKGEGKYSVINGEVEERANWTEIDEGV